MRRLSLAIIAISVLLIVIFASYIIGNQINSNVFDPPHGENFNISCNVCHSSKGWKIDWEIYSFNHDSTNMPLIGQHAQIDCKLCHPTLIFSEAKTECAQCHADIHESTVGKECSRCHTPHSWLVHNITQIHQQSRFPLIGVHAKVDCNSCHQSETFFRFEVLGTECYSCHSGDYAATTQPNHSSLGYSTQCTDCHTIFSSDWTGSGIDHSFFPLTQGHSAVSCTQCHINGIQTKPSTDCYSCHQSDYSATINPNHSNSNFSTNCTMCHTTVPGWKPATFDHSKFPLTKAHANAECTQCHINGNYSNTSGECVSCHLTNYNATNNPAHATLGFSTNCIECHTTDPDWKPATYNHTNFPLTKGHAINDCARCHINGNYSNTSNECVSCHQADYNTTANPVHVTLNFSTNCIECHTTDPGWKPAKYLQHDALSFPIYSGKHQGEWTNCTDCHTNADNYKVFDCLSCHAHNKTDMDDKHKDETGYSYTSAACFNCHPKGRTN